ncbi:hypothetical protein [Psychrobacter lutiphocae]|uniref:hypothetical protein n=1 Tax=Psychrobacter lutiphocae TaxID=540500 RepID=UPI001ABF56FB|nr:hypothetical protein [Psychrobacter lutiphocae]
MVCGVGWYGDCGWRRRTTPSECGFWDFHRECELKVRFSLDSSGILLRSMAMRTVARGSVEVTAMHLATIVRTP